MSTMLGQLGEDLAKQVHKHDLPTVNLEISKPTIKGKTLFDVMIRYLSRELQNSLFLVGEDTDYLYAYTNSIAALMDNSDILIEHLTRSGHRYLEGTPLSGPPQDQVQKYVDRLLDKRLHTLHIDRLLKLTQNDYELWKQIVPQVFSEAREEGYFFVIYNLDRLFDAANAETLWQQAMSFFLASRGRPKLTFIAPIDWWSFSKHIENGMAPGIIMHVFSVLFSPRPAELPPFSIEGWEPERFYDF
ncbi:MAG: hypothetical protein L0154_16925 [Chloroflexi bacterium]|nr:hypothetical protein [Chloroflexota bacterium]